MKVILLKDINNVGDEHETINVSEGYARNYLFPRKLAILSTPAAIAEQERNKKRIDAKKAEKKSALVKVAKELEKLNLEIKADIGEAGKLFGSVTNLDIADAIKAACGKDIEKKKIIMENHIKMLGEYTVVVRLMADVEAKIKVVVSAN